MHPLLQKISKEQQRQDVVPFKVGDVVDIGVKIKEGDKERVQQFAGTVIARDGHGGTETFTVRRISFGTGVERVFPVHSPYIDSIKVTREGKARRAKLYYVRDLIGKAAKAGAS